MVSSVTSPIALLPSSRLRGEDQQMKAERPPIIQTGLYSVKRPTKSRILGRVADKRSYVSSAAICAGEGGVCGFLERPADCAPVRVCDVRALDHQDINPLFPWVEPCLGAIGSAVAEGTGRKRGSYPLRCTDYAPAEPPAVSRREAGFQVARLECGHQLNGLWLQVCLPSARPHSRYLAEPPVVRRRGEEPAVCRRVAIGLVGFLPFRSDLRRFKFAPSLGGTTWRDGGVLLGQINVVSFIPMGRQSALEEFVEDPETTSTTRAAVLIPTGNRPISCPARNGRAWRHTTGWRRPGS